MVNVVFYKSEVEFRTLYNYSECGFVDNPSLHLMLFLNPGIYTLQSTDIWFQIDNNWRNCSFIEPISEITIKRSNESYFIKVNLSGKCEVEKERG